MTGRRKCAKLSVEPSNKTEATAAATATLFLTAGELTDKIAGQRQEEACLTAEGGAIPHMKEKDLEKRDAEIDTIEEEEILLSPSEVCSPEFSRGCIASEEE